MNQERFERCAEAELKGFGWDVREREDTKDSKTANLDDWTHGILLPKKEEGGHNLKGSQQ